MSRYYLHVRDIQGDIIEDEEGSDFPSLAAARDHALADMKALLAEAIKDGEDPHFEAVVVADAHGRHVAAVPIVAALPPGIVNLLKNPAKAVPLNTLEDYRRNADGCRSMAENADDPDDKMSWLKLADAWLQLLPKHDPAASPDGPGWPKASDEHSKSSH
jgi:hypothetical protein